MLLDEPFWSSLIAAFPSSVRSLVAMTCLFSSITVDRSGDGVGLAGGRSSSFAVAPSAS